MASLCLNMIVKNESHIIEETLENICAYFPLTYWVIADTGSTDNTIELIKNFFKRKNIEGEIHQHPWQDFGYNRNQALDACEGKADYVLFFDADDLVQGTLHLPSLGEFDGYHFKFTDEHGSVRYQRHLIIRNTQLYRWKGVIHEKLMALNPVNETEVKGDYLVVSRRQGSRNLDPQKALNDALILERAFAEATEISDLSRYAFYCAQSYAVYATQNDSQYLAKAIEWYTKRINIHVPSHKVDDEKYVCYENLGKIYDQLKDTTNALLVWQQGIALDPNRAECWYQVAYRLHKDQDYQLAYEFAKQGAALAFPQGNRVFINKDIYDFWCLYEVCVLAWELKDLKASYQAFKKLIHHLPCQYLKNITPMILSYQPLVLKDSYRNVVNLKTKFQELGQFSQFEMIFIET